MSKNDDGFTLVEIIVAVVCSTFVVGGIALILNLAFSNYKTIRLEAELQIEAQVLENKLVSVLKGAESYEYDGTVLRVKSNKIVNNSIVPIDYYFTVENGKAYISVDEPIFTDSNYLADFVDTFEIYPQSSDTTSDGYESDITVDIGLHMSGVAYAKSVQFSLRQGE